MLQQPHSFTYFKKNVLCVLWFLFGTTFYTLAFIFCRRSVCPQLGGVAGADCNCPRVHVSCHLLLAPTAINADVFGQFEMPLQVKVGVPGVKPCCHRTTPNAQSPEAIEPLSMGVKPAAFLILLQNDTSKHDISQIDFCTSLLIRLNVSMPALH